jgi:hypothetical protein
MSETINSCKRRKVVLHSSIYHAVSRLAQVFLVPTLLLQPLLDRCEAGNSARVPRKIVVTPNLFSSVAQINCREGTEHMLTFERT